MRFLGVLEEPAGEERNPIKSGMCCSLDDGFLVLAYFGCLELERVTEVVVGWLICALAEWVKPDTPRIKFIPHSFYFKCNI